jgi:signal transduction histidine kinase
MQHSGYFPADAAWQGRWQYRHVDTARSRRFRLWGPVVVSLVVQVLGLLFVWHFRAFMPIGVPTPQFFAKLALAVAGPLALIGARKFPGPVVAVVAAAACLDLFVGPPDAGPPYLALAFAIVGAIARGARLWAWISVATGWILSVVAAVVVGLSWQPLRIILTTLGILIVTGIGEGMRTRRDHFAEISNVMAQRQHNEVQAERVRIARELHDVLAHSLSQINVQAGVGLHLMDAHPEKAKAALASIKESSKTALDEVRSVLGVLRAEGGANPSAPLVPEPDLARIAGLAASVTTQGVEVTVTGSPEHVPQAIQLALFRIVQESLTNVVRHANATTANVEIGEADGNYTVVVTDNGTAGQPAEDTGGRGLLGMHERAELLGGTLEAGPRPGGGFMVSARIPSPQNRTVDAGSAL